METEKKLRMLIPHWIEHNREHGSEFRRWAEEHTTAAEDLIAAAEAIDLANLKLAAGLEKLGGGLDYQHSHDHTHEHEHGHEHGHGHGEKD